MRTFSILSIAALGLLATTSLASAQATNFSQYSGEARAYLGGGDVPGRRWRRGYVRGADHWASDTWTSGGYYGPRGNYYAPRRTQGIPPALYHAGDPQYWR